VVMVLEAICNDVNRYLLISPWWYWNGHLLDSYVEVCLLHSISVQLVMNHFVSKGNSIIIQIFSVLVTFTVELNLEMCYFFVHFCLYKTYYVTVNMLQQIWMCHMLKCAMFTLKFFCLFFFLRNFQQT
jgi:hypothetical protein